MYFPSGVERRRVAAGTRRDSLRSPPAQGKHQDLVVRARRFDLVDVARVGKFLALRRTHRDFPSAGSLSEHRREWKGFGSCLPGRQTSQIVDSRDDLTSRHESLQIAPVTERLALENSLPEIRCETEASRKCIGQSRERSHAISCKQRPYQA